MPKIPPDQCSPFGSAPPKPADDVNQPTRLASAHQARGPPTADDQYLPARLVRKRYGDVSDMSLWRWLDDPDMKFPKPMLIQKRRYWRVADLVAWERNRAEQAVA